jgi:hypothetical protein
MINEYSPCKEDQGLKSYTISKVTSIMRVNVEVTIKVHIIIELYTMRSLP